MSKSGADRGHTEYLRWRSKKKDFMILFAKGRERKAKEKLRETMLYLNRNFDSIMEKRDTRPDSIDKGSRSIDISTRSQK